MINKIFVSLVIAQCMMVSCNSVNENSEKVDATILETKNNTALVETLYYKDSLPFEDFKIDYFHIKSTGPLYNTVNSFIDSLITINKNDTELYREIRALYEQGHHSDTLYYKFTPVLLKDNLVSFKYEYYKNSFGTAYPMTGEEFYNFTREGRIPTFNDLVNEEIKSELLKSLADMEDSENHLQSILQSSTFLIQEDKIINQYPGAYDKDSSVLYWETMEFSMDSLKKFLQPRYKAILTN